jgi:hypothetical protein
VLEFKRVFKEEVHVHWTLTSGLPRMGGRKTGGKWLAICGTLLLLIWGTTATDLEGGPAVQDSTVSADPIWLPAMLFSACFIPGHFDHPVIPLHLHGKECVCRCVP